jgi:hypothetical protein
MLVVANEFVYTDYIFQVLSEKDTTFKVVGNISFLVKVAFARGITQERVK